MLRIADKSVGPGQPCYIIAEIGTNHCRSLEHTKRLIDACALAGADAVKFQSWTPLGLQNIFEFTAAGEPTPAPALPILEQYMLPDDWHGILQNYCQTKGVHFISTPFDIERADFLHSLNVPAIKISSSDVTYHELLERCSNFNVPVLLSTGMATEHEITEAVNIFTAHNTPLALLHCVGAYPPASEDANLLAVKTLSEHFGLVVGLSDHFPGHEFALVAVALGAKIIEKHVTLSRNDGAPDSPFAMETDEFAKLVKAVREIESALGDGNKQCMPSEASGLRGGRRGLYARADIPLGTMIRREHLAAVRPCLGLGADALHRFVGQQARRTIPKGYPLSLDDI